MSKLQLYWTTKQAADRLKLGTDRIRKMDQILTPMKLANGTRLFDPAVVERVVRERASK